MTARPVASAPFRFATDEVPEPDRIAIWREVLGRVHLHLDVEAVGDRPLQATVESHRWGTASLYFSDTTPVLASRTPEFVQDGDVDFRLLRADGAGYSFTAGGIEHVVQDGHAALLFNGIASTVRYLGSCRVTSIRVRRTDLIGRVTGLDERALRAVPPDSAAAHLLNDYVGLLRAQGPTGDPLLAGRVAEHLTDLVALALGATGDSAALAAGRGQRAARLAALKADVMAHLGDPELSGHSVALRHGITPRYVRKLFEESGLSVSGFVLEQRLCRAHRRLSDPHQAGQTISAIAFDCGFSDLSYFNRTFRRRFGATPSDVRAAAQNL